MEKIRGKIHFSYDSDSDVLYSYIKKPLPAKSVEMGNGIIVRINPENQKLVGFTVVNYKRRIRDGILTKIPYFEEVELPTY